MLLLSILGRDASIKAGGRFGGPVKEVENDRDERQE
jgi:hypothetical protein